MTLVARERHRCEGIYEVVEEFNITPDEILGVMSESARQDLTDEYNRICDDWNESPVAHPEELPEHVMDDLFDWIPRQEHSIEGLMLRVLDNREQNYVHTTDRAMATTFHTIIEVGDLS